MQSQTVELPFSFQHLGMVDGIRAATARNPGKIAYRHGPVERNYAQLLDRVDHISSAFLGDLGLGPGDHAAIVSKNSIEYMEIVFGACQAGVAMATVNPRLTPQEVAAICDDAQARALFVDSGSAEALKDTEFSSVEKIIDIGAELEDWINKATPVNFPRVAEWSTFTIPYTSGTTGKPKGVLVPHRSRILTLFAMASEYGCYSPDDRFLAIAPMCHGAGMLFALAPVYFGGYCEVMDKFEPEEVMRKLDEETMTGFFGVPTHFHAMMSLESKVLSQCRGESLRAIISNAAPLPQTMKETLVDHFGAGLLHETYGSTEAGIVTNLRPADQLRKQACVGQPIPCTLVEIRDEEGNECGPDEVGELFSTSPYLFNGYWGRLEATEEAYQGGWVTVGDLSRRDEEGYVYIVDRIKDMVISGGVNIYPREIEEILVRHPDISEVAVIGVPDEKWGESLKAFVVSVSGELDAAGVLEYCEDKIARLKVPKEVEFIQQLPRNASGKVLKTDLRSR